MFRRGDVVWGKLKTFPWWPAMVINPEDCGRDKVEKNKLWLFWFGDHKVAQVEYAKILDFQLYFLEKCPPKVEKVLKSAIKEALTILATRWNVGYSDTTSLFEWANKGFCTKACLLVDHTLVLPDIVEKALLENVFKPSHVCTSMGRNEDKSGSALDDVLNGDLTLEDICVMCLKLNKTITIAHPFFVGGVCEDCKVYINRIMESPKGKMAEFCILCGQGGFLVYCSDSSCLSSFCKVCIEYMTPKGTFTKVLRDKNWMCYLCKQNDDDGCFIKRREDSAALDSPWASNEKPPIRVLALSDAVMSYLVENRIKIDAYLIHPFSYMLPSPFEKSYDDFSPQEIRDLSPNFLYGSFFVESIAVSMDESQELFFTSFYKFLFRLTASRANNSHVFFAFLCDALVLDLYIMQRVKRFLKVNPSEFVIEMKKIYLWSNLPVAKHNKDKYILKKQRNSLSVEENALGSFLKPLKDLFALEQ